MQLDEKYNSLNPTSDLRQSIVNGLLYTHTRLNANQRKTLEATSFLYALVELLNEKGLITIAELDERKALVAQRLTEQVRREGNGALVQEPEYDKYNFPHGAQIDCEKRVHLCKASCCRLPFALSKQDVREGIVHWDFGQPYLIEHDASGYCTHMTQDTCACTIYDQRPAPCRGYDCLHDQRIWLDFAQMIPNPAILQPDWPASLVEQVENQEDTP